MSEYGASNSSVLIKKIKGVYTVDDSLYEKLNEFESKFIKIRPVMVPLKNSDRTIIAQGIPSGTLAVMKNRLSQNIKTSQFSYPDYLFRTESNRHETYLPAVRYYGRYSHFDLLKLNNDLNRKGPEVPNYFIENMANWDTVDYHDIYSKNPGNLSAGALDGNFDREFLFIDKNTVNF